MKNTHTSLYRSQTFSLKEGRLLYEWGANPETGGSSDSYVNEVNAREMRQYVREEKRNLPDDPAANTQRLTFLEELSDAEVGAIQFEKKFKIKFGKDADGEYVVLTKKPALLEKLLQDPDDGEGFIDNNNGTYTITTMTGGKKISLVIDSQIYEALSSHASVTVDGIPPIAKNAIPTKEPQKGKYIADYIKAAMGDLRILDLTITDKKLADFSVKKYAEMVDAVVRAHPEAIQYVMTEWANTDKNRYTGLWNIAIDDDAGLLEHLTSDAQIQAVTDYPALCRRAVEKKPEVVRFINFGQITKPADQKFIISFAAKAGPEILKLIPHDWKKFARELQLNKLVTKELSAAPTQENIDEFNGALSSTEFSSDLDSLRKYIEMSPRLMHSILPEWITAHTDEYKELWKAAVHVYPDVIAMPETLAKLKQYYKADPFGLYTELAKVAVTEHMVGQRPEDASYLPLHVDPEWRKERPADFRALFINNDGQPTGKFSLLMLLRVEGAEEAFNTQGATKNPLGYANALSDALNVENLATVLRVGTNEFDLLKKHLNILVDEESHFDTTLQKVLSQYPELHTKFLSNDKNLLEAKFRDGDSIALALSSGRNIFEGLKVEDVQKYKDVIFGVLQNLKEQPDNIAALFTQMPKEWKTPADLKELVSANASLYKFVNPDKSIDLSKIDLSIFKAALQAHIDKKGALDWLKDVPKSIRDRMGEEAPTDPSIDALVIKEEKPVEHKSAVEDMSDAAILKLTAQEVFALMRNPNEKPASVFALLLAKGVAKAPIVNDIRFLREAMNIYTDVYTFVLEDASAVTLRQKPEVEKYIVDKIEQERAQFIVLPDDLKTKPVFLKAALKKYDAADILRRSVFKTDEAFAAAMNAEFTTLSNLDKKLVAYGCTQNHLVAFSDATRAEVLQHNISLALEEMTQEQRAAKVKEMLTQDASPERNVDLKRFVASLDIQHAANALKDDSGVFDFLSYEQIGSADILEVVAGFTMRTPEMERILDVYFSLDRHEKDDREKYPNLYARFGERLEENFNRNEELETLKVVAERKIADFELYGDKAIQLEPEAERANKNSVGAWKEFALSGRLQKEFLVEDKMVNLREYIDAMDMKLNVTLLIMSGKLEWTEAELRKVDDNKAFLLIGEINQRIGFIKSGSNAAHHKKNIDRILKRLYLTPPEKITSSLVNALPKVPTLPSDLQTKMGALEEKWERAARDNKQKNEEALKRVRDLNEKK